ncbi:MAG: hypothetical protein WAM66_09070 [Acidobacteriaceae bacterium]
MKTVINAIQKIFVVSLLFTATAVYAQVARSVNGGGGAFWAGGEVSGFNPDYGAPRVIGPGAIFDLNVTPKVGLIGEARWMHWHGAGGETQSDYLIGGKYRIYRYRRFDFDAKMLIGGVWIKFPIGIGSGSYFAYAPGGFVDYHLSHNFRIRGGYEYQVLPSAPNIPGQPSNGLTPHGFSAGVEYRVFH